MKIQIDQSRCAGHARCNATSDLFPLDDDGYVGTPGFDVEPGQEHDAQLAAEACPERVISVVL